MKALIAINSFLLSSILFGGGVEKKLILSDLALLERAKIKPLYKDEATGLAVAKISTLQESILVRRSHEHGRCGGFELLSENAEQSTFGANDFAKAVAQINSRKSIDEKEMKSFKHLKARTTVADAIGDVSEAKIKEWVVWMSSYRTRYHKGPTPNEHVVALQGKLDEELKNYPALKATTSLIEHTSTKQKTLRVTIPGSTHPDEIVVLGAHLDSINVGFIGTPTNGPAPGSDDDASGSASNLEALAHLMKMAPFDRTLEIFFYAGEEGGLLGSKEVAADYKSKNKKVVGVLQLDMTLFPGSGKGNIVSMTDFTSPELRNLLSEINRLYLNVNILEDKCGYACSDHASWYKNGYPTLIPSEATFAQMNHAIHSADDVINSGSSFEHAAIFSKIAIAFAAHLANP
jgi:leucyl aminopeptidase